MHSQMYKERRCPAMRPITPRTDDRDDRDRAIRYRRLSGSTRYQWNDYAGTRLLIDKDSMGIKRTANFEQQRSAENAPQPGPTSVADGETVTPQNRLYQTLR